MKNHKHLRLNSECIRNLTASQLSAIGGGGDATALCPNTAACPPPPLPTLQTCPTAKGVC